MNIKFKLTTDNPKLMKVPEVKKWIEKTEKLLNEEIKKMCFDETYSAFYEEKSNTIK